MVLCYPDSAQSDSEVDSEADEHYVLAGTVYSSDSLYRIGLMIWDDFGYMKIGVIETYKSEAY